MSDDRRLRLVHSTQFIHGDIKPISKSEPTPKPGAEIKPVSGKDLRQPLMASLFQRYAKHDMNCTAGSLLAIMVTLKSPCSCGAKKAYDTILSTFTR